MGIESIKAVVGFVLTAIDKFGNIDADGDGKTEWTEVLGVVSALGFNVPSVIRAIPNIKDEWNDLSDDEVAELLDYFKTEFDIKNDATEATIEAVLDSAFRIFVVVQEIISETKG